MKALVLEDYCKLVCKDVPQPEPGPGEVLIAVRACGICGSDVHGMDGSTGRRRPPLIMGHEAAGVIAEAARDVSGWKAGDHVTFDSTVYCGNCVYCRTGRVNLCDSRRVLGVSCEEYRRDGAFAEYVAVPAHILYRLPETLSFERAAMVEALSIAVHAVSRARITPETTALVFGAGVIGLLAVQVLRASGATRIIAVDIDKRRLALAERLGADTVLDAAALSVPEEVKRLSGGRGADVALEVVGLPETFTAALASVKRGGSLVLVGNLSSEVALPLQKTVTGEIDILGSCASAGEYPVCLDMMARGAVDVDSLTSAVAPLAEGAAWFARLYDRKDGLLKVILTP